MIPLLTGDGDAPNHILLAHGAGAPMTSPFMERIATLLAAEGLAVWRFEFDYMAGRREGEKRPPPRAERLNDEYLAAVGEVLSRLGPGRRLLIGGKSMGGRVASMVADGLHHERRIAALVCLGYPFHPPGARTGTEVPSVTRTAHLMRLDCPALFVQGERDPFGARSTAKALGLPPSIRFHWVHDGDHDLAPRARSGTTHAANLAEAVRAIAAFSLGGRAL
ncbi:MAG: alpha/beta hydrolase [Hyphomicrobium sp.]|nr:MAG: alpha/beta hydrolase [Hyphomicrobium sp.]